MKIIFLCLGLISLTCLIAQEKLFKLKKEPVDIEINDFYIEKVIDGRSNKENIGIAQVGFLNKKVAAGLEGGVEHEVGEYLEEVLPKDTTQTPIVLKILYLKIKEKTTFSNEKGSAEIKLEFYTHSDGELNKVYVSDQFVEQIQMDVTRGHEERIRKVLIAGIREFNNSDWQNATSSPLVKEENIEDPVDVQDSTIEDVKNSPRWNSLLTLRRSWALDSDGWAVTYYGYSAPDDRKWFIPWMISFERFNLNPVLLVNSGYNKIQLSYWKPGLSYFYKLGKYFHANASLFVPIGNETLTKVNGKESDNFLIGIHPSQGIYFISESNFGITMGVSIYEVLMNSEIYGGDFGVQVEFGLKF